MAGVRVYDFDTGPTTAVAPAAGTPSAADDLIPKSYADANYGVTVTGTRAAPTSIVAGTGIAAPTGMDNIAFVQGSGGAVDISANPQIAAGTTVGQRMVLIGRSNTNTLTLDDGTGLSLNGSITLEADDILTLLWDGTNWVELYRKDAS